jgi:hypothetical protein
VSECTSSHPWHLFARDSQQNPDGSCQGNLLASSQTPEKNSEQQIKVGFQLIFYS